MLRIILNADPVFKYPADRTAARVLRPGVKYEPAKKVLTGDQAVPFPTREFTAAMLACPAFSDLTGRRFGRLTVYGLAEEKNGRWACRCDCGMYVLRTRKAAKNPSNDRDRCEHCRHLAYLQRDDHFRQTGKDREGWNT